MADEKEGEEASLSRSRLLLKKLTSITRVIISKPPLPLLPVTNSAINVAENLQKMELGKLALTVATTATLGLLFSQKFPAAEADYFVVLGFMAACAAVWNGVLFGKISLQLLGISLILVCLYGLVGSFLPSRFSWACWLFGAFSLIPFLSLLIKPHPLAS